MNPTSPLERDVRADGDVIVKIQDPIASRRERLRTAAGSALGKRSGLFRVPGIVSFDDARGEIVFERMPRDEPWPVLADPTHHLDLVTRVATALATIHRDLEVSDGATAMDMRTIGIDRPRTLVPLHGDFGLGNMFHTPSSDQLTIIDWSNADWIGIEADLGAPELDVTVFLVSLFHRRAFGPRQIALRRVLARHFLTTYASASPYGLDLDTLNAVVAALTPRFNDLTRQRKGRMRALTYRHSMIDLNFFLRRLSAEDFPDRHEPDAG